MTISPLASYAFSVAFDVGGTDFLDLGPNSPEEFGVPPVFPCTPFPTCFTQFPAPVTPGVAGTVESAPGSSGFVFTFEAAGASSNYAGSPTHKIGEITFTVSEGAIGSSLLEAGFFDAGDGSSMLLEFGEAHAGTFPVVVDLEWGSSSNSDPLAQAGVGSETILASPGDVLQLDAYVTMQKDQNLESYSFSLLFDADLNDELEIVSVIPIVNPPYFSFGLPLGTVQESSSSQEGSIEQIGALGSCSPCAQNVTFQAASVIFVVNGSVQEDGVDVSALLQAFSDGFFDDASNEIPFVRFGDASVDNLDVSDFDEDGVLNIDDNCPLTANPLQEDTDGDGVGDACNDADDADRDEFADSLDVCPNLANPGQEDTDGDGVGDACNDASDTDGDEFADALDNCILESDASQLDANMDGFGNLCDADYNNDGVVGIPDFVRFRASFGMAAPEIDLTGDGVVGIPDFSQFRARFEAPPGPSGLSCAGTIPCP